MNTQRKTRSLRLRSLSLEHKLPLAVSGLLSILLLLYIWLAYRDVSRLNALATAERNTRLATDLGQVLSTITARRGGMVTRAANTPAVQQALSGGPIAPAKTVLGTLTVSPNEKLVVLMLDSKRRPVLQVGMQPSAEMLRRMAGTLDAAEHDSQAATSPFFIDGDQAYYWSAARVHADGRTLGFVTQLRAFITSEAGARAIRGPIDDSTYVAIANTADPNGPMYALGGHILPPPRRSKRDGEVERIQRDGAWYIVGRDTAAGTPFTVIVQTPTEFAGRHAHVFLERTILIGLLLLVIGTLAIWWISRRFTRPIRELSTATEALAARNYDQRVRVERTDELGMLAHGFNRMAGEIRRALREAEENKAAAERADRAKSEFLANMSHEIRTPINAMLGYADLMEMGIAGPITDEQRTQLERIRVSGKHLIGLVDDLLDFARLETARMTIEDRAASADQAVQTALTVMEPLAAAKPVELSVDVEPGTQYFGDPRRVEQILVNLVDNAVKFTPAGGHVRISSRMVQPTEQAPHAEFVVEDTGIGISSDRMQSVFEPFVQAHTGYTRPHGGSGLGLTISRRLAELMGGTITAESRENVGSRFTLVLRAPLESS